MTKHISKKEFLKLYIWTLSYFKPFILLTIIYVLCGGTMIWGELMIPRRIGFLIDHVLPLKSMPSLVNQILLLSGFVALILVSKSLFNFLEQVIASKIIRRQQTDLMVKLQDLGFSYYDKVPTGQLLSLFENTVKETQQTYTFLFPQLIYCLAQFTVPSVILILNAPIFFGAAMVGNVIYVFLNQFANQKIHHYLGLETKAAHKSQQSLYDAIVAAPELKAMGSKDWLINKALEDFNQFRLPRMQSIFWRHFRFTTVGLTLTISVVLFYVFGLDLVKSGNLLLGEFIGYSFLMGLVSRGFSVFFYIIPAQYHALSYAKYLYEFMHLKPDVVEGQHGLETLTGASNSASENPFNSASGNPNNQPLDIAFKHVSFSYNPNQPIINDVSLWIPAGKKTAIVGESGSGKSTLLKLIGRFYDVTQGAIEIGGHDIKGLKLSHLRQHFGYVFQDAYLFDMSIKENIRFAKPEASDDDVMAAAQRASAHQFILATENGYDTKVGERGVRLSGGQKQRISIARMMLKNPQIILMDEATSALDHVTESAVKQSIDELSDGRTVVTVAHRLSTIMDYDQIIVLEAGSIVAQGTYDHLMAQKGAFYRLATRGADNEV